MQKKISELETTNTVNLEDFLVLNQDLTTKKQVFLL
jgi:hypothetical protein